eukprot:COSAG02_NODE_440_length_22296_cov_173.657386_16_plen_715_part_00
MLHGGQRLRWFAWALLSATLLPSTAGITHWHPAAANSTAPAAELIGRVLGADAVEHFELLLLPEGQHCANAAPPCFALTDAPAGKLRVEASSVSELTYGIGYYLRFYCAMTVGWPTGGGSYTQELGGARMTTWPRIGASGFALHRAVPLSWEDNVCTHSYSYPWYTEAMWRQHVDWMALAGINRFYAVTGQEEIQYKTFRKFNLSDIEIRSFFNGPAYLTWSRGQSMQGVGAPLPRSWMQKQWALQKQILAMARPLGIIGVLPAFQGNMPPQIKWSHPYANVSAHPNTWHGKPGDEESTKGVCAWVSGSDPLFGQVADQWMQIMIDDWGTDHWYQCDGFFTGLPPPWDASGDDIANLNGDEVRDPSNPSFDAMKVEPDPAWTVVWKGAWEGMARTDPQAHWLYQGWAIRGWSDEAGMSRLRALFDVVPHGQWIPLDMDISGIWRYSGNYSFFGAPFIWTTLHNMGGNDGMKGDMRMMQTMPSDALQAGASIIGTGATPEGIDQNPAYYEYAYDTAWHVQHQPLEEWFGTYAARRYGYVGGCKGRPDCEAATSAWAVLLEQVYHSQAGGWHDNTGVTWAWDLVPSWIYGTGAPEGSIRTMNLTAMRGAFDQLIFCAETLAKASPHGNAIPDTLNYDIINVGRELLAQLSSISILNITTAVSNQDRDSALKAGGLLMEIFADLDKLLACGAFCPFRRRHCFTILAAMSQSKSELTD